MQLGKSIYGQLNRARWKETKKYLVPLLPSSQVLLNSSIFSFQEIQEGGEWGLCHTRIAVGVFWQKPPFQPPNTKILQCKSNRAALRPTSKDIWVRTMLWSSHCEESACYTREFQNLLLRTSGDQWHTYLTHLHSKSKAAKHLLPWFLTQIPPAAQGHLHPCNHYQDTW